MKAIVVTDQAAGWAGVKLVERPEPLAAINDVVVQIHASAFTGDELTWPRPGPIASAVTGRLQSPGTNWPEWSPLSAMARQGCRLDSGCSASRTGIATARWRSMPMVIPLSKNSATVKPPCLGAAKFQPLVAAELQSLGD